MNKRANPDAVGETDVFLNNLGADLKNNALLYGGLTLGAGGIAGLLSAARPRKPGESKGQRVRRTINNMLRASLGTAGGITAYSAAKNLTGLGGIDPSNVVRTADGRLETPPPEPRPAGEIGKDIGYGAGALGLMGAAGFAGGRAAWDMGESQLTRFTRANPRVALAGNLRNSQPGTLAGMFVGGDGRAITGPGFENALIRATNLLPGSSSDAQIRALNQLYGTTTGGIDELGGRLRENINKELQAAIRKAAPLNPNATAASLPVELRDKAVRRAIINSVGAGDSKLEAARRWAFGSTGRGELNAGRAGRVFQRNTGSPRSRAIFSLLSAFGLPAYQLINSGGEAPPPTQ